MANLFLEAPGVRERAGKGMKTEVVTSGGLSPIREQEAAVSARRQA
jgi:hypothetical protein